MMSVLYLSKGWDKRGGPMYMIGRLLQEYTDVKLKTYTRQRSGVLLAYNVLPKACSPKLRKVVFIAGCKMSDNGVPRNNPWRRIDHVVFNSDFIKQISETKFSKIGRSSVIYMVGGAPADDNNMVPLDRGKQMSSEVEFMVSAKWWKRPFKRQRQTVKLFNEFILPKYPSSKLHVLGNRIDKSRKIGRVVYYPKTFHRDTVADIYKRSHIQLVLTAFDTGPLTLNESLHYRVPFICSNNCCGREFMAIVKGKCGEMVKTDRDIRTAKHCDRFKPMVSKKYYNRELSYDRLMQSVDKVIENYDEYTSWSWTPDFSYQSQATKWLEVLFG